MRNSIIKNVQGKKGTLLVFFFVVFFLCAIMSCQTQQVRMFSRKDKRQMDCQESTSKVPVRDVKP